MYIGSIINQLCIVYIAIIENMGECDEIDFPIWLWDYC